jgi:uroporphyrinogen decarboxylase
MNARERYVETLSFGNPDKIPFRPGGPRESTRAAWEKQGLSDGDKWRDYLWEMLGLEEEDTGPHVPLGVDFRIIPQFEEKVLEHAQGHYIVQDWMGAITEISDAFDYTYIRRAKDFVTRKWHRFPVQSREDWNERIKWRYDLDAPGRFPEDFDERCEALNQRDYPLTVHFNGPFWQVREWVGMENLCVLMATEPDFAMEMCNFWGDFVYQMLERILPKVEVDNLHWSEDMAYKAHSMISPTMVRKFLVPQYERWIDIGKQNGVELFDIDSDGNIEVLIPIWVDVGVNVCDPIEVAAGNDIIEYRNRFGTEMAYVGGIDKRAIAAGGDVMRAEVMRVVPPLLEEGGFIPSCDHGVPPDISWPNFVEYSRLLAELTGWL